MTNSINLIINRFLQLQEKIFHLEKKYYRLPGSIKIIVVSKGQPIEYIEALANIGVRDFAENFVQEACIKICQLQTLSLRWHFIGRIQHNKIRNIVRFFDIVHSIADVKTAFDLNLASSVLLKPIQACLQVNLQKSLKKAGFSEGVLLDPLIFNQLMGCHHLKLIGLMTILDQDLPLEKKKEEFAAVNKLQAELNNKYRLSFDVLSMGMSNDYEAAIAAGATWLRLGRAIWLGENY